MVSSLTGSTRVARITLFDANGSSSAARTIAPSASASVMRGLPLRGPPSAEAVATRRLLHRRAALTEVPALADAVAAVWPSAINVAAATRWMGEYCGDVASSFARFTMESSDGDGSRGGEGGEGSLRLRETGLKHAGRKRRRSLQPAVHASTDCVYVADTAHRVQTIASRNNVSPSSITNH